MEQIYDVFKAFIDPVFIIFVILIISFLIWLLPNKKKSDTLILFFAVVLLYGASIFPVCNFLSYKLEKDYINKPLLKDKIKLDVVVVLSGGTYDINFLNKTFVGETTIVRLVHAVQMYKSYDAKYFVCSGKSDSKIPDAQLMAQMAEELGVPPKKIRIEAKSNNTYNHAQEFKKMFVNKNLKIGLVTSAYHMRRSEKEFRKYFKNVYPLPSSYFYASPMGTAAVRYIPQSRWLYNNTLILREYLGQIWYSIKDRV
ncbi:MAG: YdcF family protein [Syntrophaceae bacterium]|nr:YdcF family protein [Syntrophaceae bacterium]